MDVLPVPGGPYRRRCGSLCVQKVLVIEFEVNGRKWSSTFESTNLLIVARIS